MLTLSVISCFHLQVISFMCIKGANNWIWIIQWSNSKSKSSCYRRNVKSPCLCLCYRYVVKYFRSWLIWILFWFLHNSCTSEALTTSLEKVGAVDLIYEDIVIEVPHNLQSCMLCRERDSVLVYRVGIASKAVYFAASDVFVINHVVNILVVLPVSAGMQ